MKRSASLRRYTRLRSESRKRRRQRRARAKCRQAVYRRADGVCELQIAGVCLYLGGQVHELKPRGRGGSIVDPANGRLACQACHDHVHANPAEAAARGFLVSASAPPSQGGATC